MSNYDPENWPEVIKRAMANAGWTTPTPVQVKAIPYFLEGRDAMMQSRTGSGKTGAFILPILAKIDPAENSCQALILVPTRELALQVSREAELLSKDSGTRVIAVYGGVGYGPQVQAFQAGAHIVVGTPGRILDHLVRRTLDLRSLRILIFDEADRMMSMGFYPDMRQIRGFLPKQRNGFMFSATYPVFVQGLAGEFLREPEFVSLSSDSVHVTEVEHVYYEVPQMEKDRALVRIIEFENPLQALIFCNRKDKVNYVATVLQRFGYDADQLTADISQRDRERVMQRLRSGSLRLLVATDVAARGIDIPSLSHVFLYEFPEDPESYIHRTGRTGRAGAAGTAISLLAYTEIGEIERVARTYKIDTLKRDLPSDEDVQNLVAERTIALLEAKVRDRDRLQLERMRRFVPLARSLGESEDELDVMAMLLDDFYQNSLHAPAIVLGEPQDEVKPQAKDSGPKPSSENRGPQRRRRRP